jgi:DNA-binding CsgD family transcriptional regulator
MGHRFHRGFTAAEKTELWDRWKRGESLKAIGRAFGKPSSSIYFLVAPHGGIRPAERRRSRLALTLAEREVISRGITARQSARSLAKLLGRSPSTVSREVSRNGGHDRYRATLADESAWARARRPKCCKLANSPRLRQAVAGKLRLDWSPEQIAGWLKRTYPEDEYNQVSHETIYRSLFVQTRGVLKKELLSHLRSKRSMRRSKPVDPNGDRRGHIKDIVSNAIVQVRGFSPDPARWPDRPGEAPRRHRPCSIYSTSPPLPPSSPWSPARRWCSSAGVALRPRLCPTAAASRCRRLRGSF